MWGHLYLGMIFDMLGQRERAVNEYSKAKQTNDNTGGAQETADRYLKKPFAEGGTQAAATTKANDAQPAKTPPPDDGRPHLKKQP